MMITSDNQVMQFVWKDNSIVLFQSVRGLPRAGQIGVSFN